MQQEIALISKHFAAEIINCTTLSYTAIYSASVAHFHVYMHKPDNKISQTLDLWYLHINGAHAPWFSYQDAAALW